MSKPGYRFALFATLLAVVVVLLGAYTRLTHAGLGCPDWPGCYGFISVPKTEAQLAHEQLVLDNKNQRDKIRQLEAQLEKLNKSEYLGLCRRLVHLVDYSFA